MILDANVEIWKYDNLLIIIIIIIIIRVQEAPLRGGPAGTQEDVLEVWDRVY